MTAASLVPLLAAIPAPDPLPVPAPPGLLRGLLLLTFFLHLLPMNLLLGGALVALVNRLSGREPARELARDIARALPVVVAATVTLGVAPLLFLQVLYGRLFFASAIAIGWWWLAVFPLVIAGYYGAYRAAHLARQMSPRGRLAALIVAAAFVAVSFIYVNNMTLMLDPDRVTALHLAASAGTSLNLGEPTLGPRWLHMVSGAFAVTGLALALYGVLHRDRSAASAPLLVPKASATSEGAVPNPPP